MGSFPNKTAAQILRTLFIDKDISAAPALFTSNAGNTKGIYTEASTGVTPLYIGLISGGAASSGNSIPNGQSNLSSILNDAAIVSSGTNGWPVVAGTRQLKEFTASALNNGTSRQLISFNVQSSTTEDGGSIITITGPTNPIAFAGTGGVSNGQQSYESIIGFFITTLASANGNASNLPTVLAYGTLSASRNVQVGDNPTFAANSITITLD
jgi:hypothetical protein